MSWTEIVLEVPRDQAERLSDALMESGALSVSVEDADEGTESERPLFGEPGMEPEQHAWERSRVLALADEGTDLHALVSGACALCELHPLPSFNSRSVADQDWVRLTQSQFEPIPIGQRIWVVPSWHQAPEPDAIVLELDPGLAFGTGSHPTTRLCMEWMEANLKERVSLLDYGCGSGILAMLGEKLGARPVDGVDIDPQAILSARDNSVRNHCNISYFLPEDFAEDRKDNRYALVVANILSGPLKVMAPMLCGRVAAGGQLLLSGVLARQAEEVIAAYSGLLSLSVWDEREGWVALAGRRSGLAID
jgi:ribosomal protein L11 methyltransferase